MFYGPRGEASPELEILMKKEFKSAVVILALLILFSVAGCSSVSSEEAFDLSFDPEVETNYNGEHFVIYGKKELVYDPEKDSLFVDLVYDRMRELQDRFNIFFDYKEGDFHNILKVNVASGQYICEFAISDTWNLHDSILSGLLIPVDQLDTGIDYTNYSKWGNKNQLTSFCFNDHLYGVIPMYWPGFAYYQVEHFFFVNEDMVAAIGQPDPREFVDNGQWNRATMTDLVENRYTHTNAASEHVYALSSGLGHFMMSTIVTSGIDYVINKGNGVYTSGYKEPDVIDKLKWGSDFVLRNKDINMTSGTDTMDTIYILARGHCTMVLTRLDYGLNGIQYDIDNFGILPFPLSDDLQGHDWMCMHDAFNHGIFMPLTAKDPDNAAFIANAIFEPLKGYETEELRLDYYDRYIFHDSRDTKVVFDSLKICKYTHFNEKGDMIASAVLAANGSKSIVQILEENDSSYEYYMERIYIPIQRTIDNLFGEG